MQKTLLLFDVDGTIMITCGASSRSIHRAMRDVFGDEVQWGPITVGTLDPQIFAQLAAHNGIEANEQAHDRYKKRYLEVLEDELLRVRDDVIVLPGIRQLLADLHARAAGRGDVMLGLQTGNYGQAVALKLAAADINRKLFPVAAFAENGQKRDDLPHAAMCQYERLTNERAESGRVLIIGDTPRDVECAKTNGCVAVGVATGRYSIQELEQAGADLVVESLADPTPLYRLHERL